MFDTTVPESCLIDTHCHLDAPEFAGRTDAVVGAARAAGVGQLLVPAVSQATFSSTLAMRARYGCWVALGLHPIYLDQHLDSHLDDLDRALALHQPDAVGEIGLDFYQPELDPARQERLFVEQLRLARQHGLPVILHVRRAQDRVLKYLRQVRVEGGIAHAFNGSLQQAEAFIALGFRLGFGGAMTYSGSQRIRRLAATLPADALVLETDAPDIRPEWAQTEPNTPANLPRFLTLLAGLRGETEEKLCRILVRNSLSALGKN